MNSLKANSYANFLYKYQASETGRSKKKKLVGQSMIIHFRIIQRGKKINAKPMPKVLFLLKGPIEAIQGFASIFCRRRFAYSAEPSTVFCGLCYRY